MSNYDKISIKDGKLKISGALFANTDRKSDNHPNAKSWDKENKIGWAAWTKVSEKGTKYQSVNVELDISSIPQHILSQLCGGAAPVQQAQPQRGGMSNNDLEDVPFGPIW